MEMLVCAVHPIPGRSETNMWKGAIHCCHHFVILVTSSSLFSLVCHSCHHFVILVIILSLLSSVHNCFHQFVIAEINMMENSNSMLSQFCSYRRREGFKNSKHRNQPLTDGHRLAAKKGTCWCLKRFKQCFWARNALPYLIYCILH